MTAVSMIGLGEMGSALARAFLAADHAVTVWNRSAAKIEPLVDLGAHGAATVAEAVAASPLIVVCIDNYAATHSNFDDRAVAALLDGKLVVQLSTGTPREAREAEAWFNGHGAAYLDGAIDCYPDGIGEPDSRIDICGSRSAFERCQRELQCLAGTIRYLGDNIAAAAALDLAGLAHSLGMYAGFAHGARLCEAEGVGADLLAASFAPGERARELAEIVHAGDYRLGAVHDGTTVRVWGEVAKRLQSQASDADINSELPDLYASLHARGVEAGHGEEDIAALLKVLRNKQT